LKNGLGERIMFGTDQMRWPKTFGMAIGVIESTSSLTGAERRDILYNNAARFLRLSSNSGRD
jgi:predicted TIM-barrel fold metal-dependent hydrolase